MQVAIKIDLEKDGRMVGGPPCGGRLARAKPNTWRSSSSMTASITRAG